MTALKRLNRVHWLIVLCIVLAVTAVGGDVTLHVVQQQRIDALRSTLAQTRTTDATEFNALLGKAEKNSDQLKQSGQTPAETLPSPKQVTGTPGAAGATGAAGASGLDGTSVVASECTGSGLEMFYSDGTRENAGQCIGPPGKNGTDGQAGAPGLPGAAGTDGAIGPAGPAGPAGQDGKDGTDGKDGANGTSVTSVTCVLEPDGTTTAFEFTFTDASSTTTTQDVPGACTPPSP